MYKRAALTHWQDSAEISSKMCSIRNQSRMGTEGTAWNLRSEGYEMGLAKGRGFSAKRSAGHFTSSESSACRRRDPKQVRMPGIYVPFIASQEISFWLYFCRF